MGVISEYRVYLSLAAVLALLVLGLLSDRKAPVSTSAWRWPRGWAR